MPLRELKAQVFPQMIKSFYPAKYLCSNFKNPKEYVLFFAD
jgi:hypothetical protein